MSRSPGGGPAVPPDHPSHPTRLHLTQPWVGRIDHARPLLDGTDDGWLGRRIDEGGDGSRRYETDLVLPIREQATHMVLRKAAVVEIGPLEMVPDGFEAQVSWRSANLAPLFPVFVGRLSVAPEMLELDGYYAPPGGEVGVILDRALLNIAARGTARWFLTKVAETLEHAPDR